MTKKGFTLIELMVVIVIISMLAMIISNFDWNKKTNVEKQDRFVGKISSIIHSTLLNASSGKGIKSGTEIINPTSTHIKFSTGSIGVYYYSGTTVSTGEVINSPFFGDVGFTLSNIYGKKKDSSTGSISPLPIEIIFDNNNDMYFTGSDSNLSSYIGIGMNVGYHGTEKIFEFDRRFGKITLY